MFKDTKFDRRRFISSAAIAIAAAELGLTDSVHAHLRETEASGEAIESGLNKSFGLSGRSMPAS